MTWPGTFLKLQLVVVFLWNFILYFLAFFFGLLYSQGDLYISVLLYVMIGATSSFWTNHLLLTLLPSAIAFPLGFAIFGSAMYANDTNGKSTQSLWETLGLMGRDGLEILIISVIAASIGWLVVRFFLRQPGRDRIQRARPYVLLLSIGFVLAYFIFLMLGR